MSGSDDETIRVWNVETGDNISVHTGHTSPVELVAFSPDGKHVASSFGDGTLLVWDTETGDIVYRLFKVHPSEVHFVAFSLT